MPRGKDSFLEFDKIYAAPNVEASARKDIYLSEFKPKSKLAVPEHHVHRPRFPVVDFHTHFGSGVISISTWKWKSSPDEASRRLSTLTGFGENGWILF